MRRAVFSTLLTVLLVSSVAGVVIVQKAIASPKFEVDDLIQVTDGSSFNRPGGLVRNKNGSFMMFSSCYEPEFEPFGLHFLEVIFSQNGSAWGSPQRLPFPPNCVYPSAIQDQNGVYWVAWEQQSCGASSILVANSSNGVDWSGPFKASSGVNGRPSLMQDRNGLYWIAYEDNTFGAEDILVRNSTDGVNWGAPIYVTERSDDYSDIMTSLTQDSDGTYWIVMTRIAQVWDGGSRIWISHSNDGTNWSPPTKIETGMESHFPHMAQGSQGSYVMVWKAFNQTPSGNDNMWISKSSDCLHWGSPQQLTYNEENSLLTCLLAEEDAYYIVYDVWKTWNITTCEEVIWMMVVKEAPTPPVAHFTYNPLPCLLEDAITFNAFASYDVDGEIVSYLWDFGDSSSAKGPTVTHSYSSAGNFTVTLTVVDNDGRTSRASQNLWVDVESTFRGPMVISIQGSRTVVGQGLTVSFQIDVENQGAMIETYDLTLLTNTTIVAIFENITQASETVTTLSTVWDTTGFTNGIYSINTQVTNHRGETNIVHMYSLEICVSLLGDVDGNLNVNIYDIVLAASVYGLHKDVPLYNANCDVDDDGDIDLFDVVLIAGNYGKGL
ncbi:MAG: PKD domain-containing protein [Candidatus Bathyarchaeota archaeon]|nr:MAG: PKD domain-containing protein [Candidatus Bathyarchaeota archaeon]